jgi:acyl carrier protein
MTTNNHAGEMIDFLKRQILHDRSMPLEQDTPLVSSGLVDSFALVEVLLELERVTNRQIPAGRVSPADLDTVRKMLDMAERVGKPVN